MTWYAIPLLVLGSLAVLCLAVATVFYIDEELPGWVPLIFVPLAFCGLFFGIRATREPPSRLPRHAYVVGEGRGLFVVDKGWESLGLILCNESSFDNGHQELPDNSGKVAIPCNNGNRDFTYTPAQVYNPYNR